MWKKRRRDREGEVISSHFIIETLMKEREWIETEWAEEARVGRKKLHKRIRKKRKPERENK